MKRDEESVRELLEMAAKAVQLSVLGWAEGRPFVQHGLFSNREWNPLDGDGDSRRLQVALRIDTDWNGGVFRARAHDCTSGTHFGIVGRDGSDEAAAARLAVLRAAADIGRAMP